MCWIMLDQSLNKKMVKSRVIEIFPSETLTQVIGIIWLFTEKLQRRTKYGKCYYIPISQEDNDESVHTVITHY